MKFPSLRLLLIPPRPIKPYSTLPTPPPTILINSLPYPTDTQTNVTPTILSKLPRSLHTHPTHPLSILRSLISSHFSSFEHLSTLSPIVTTVQNFDSLGFAADHPGRRKTDSYYINREWMLRTHTSAHEVEFFEKGKERWLLAADVYRRDEIDSTHYPVFHQMEGACVADKRSIGRMVKENEEMEKALKATNISIEDPTFSTGGTDTNPYQTHYSVEEQEIVARHLKNSLNGLVWALFGKGNEEGEPLKVRWIEATFPWTGPSYEVEVFFQGEWLEILGCGVVRHETLVRSGVPNKIGWAFGLGLERIAMILFKIPDIRLFWSEDPRFLSQFSKGEVVEFKSYSKFEKCYKDFSFWLAVEEGEEEWHENNFCEVVRGVAGDLVESVQLIDDFVHPKTGRRSMCYRLNYRSMDRSLSNEEVNEIQERVIKSVVDQMGVEVR